MKNPRLNPRLFWITLASVALALVTFQGLFAGQPNGAYDWVVTPAAQIRTDAGECYVEGAPVQEVCVQWCVITVDGEILPQNQFACRPYY